MSKTLNILIADDNGLMRLVMKGFFLNFLQSPKITESASLQDAFEILNQQKFDLLLLDINMPEGDSNPNTVREILVKWPNLKVCMFSGNDKKTLETGYLEAGAIAFIQKDENMVTSAEELIKAFF